MKNRISWGLLLWTVFLILIMSDIKNLKYFFNLLKELHQLLKKNSKYIEDNDFVLIHKTQIKNL